MTPLNFAIIGLRLLGIHFIITSGSLFASSAIIAAGLKQMTEGMGIGQSLAILFSTLFPGGLFVLFGCLLFFFSVPLARRLAPPVLDQSRHVGCSFEELQAIVFAAVGIILIAMALPNFGIALRRLFLLLSYLQQTNDFTENHWENLMYSIGVLAQIVIGAFLLLNPKRFRNLWRSIQTSGT